MTVIFNPTALLDRVAPEERIVGILNADLSVKKRAIRTLARADFLSSKNLYSAFKNVSKFYKKKVKSLMKDGELKSDAIEDTVNDGRLLVSRVHNEIVQQASAEIKDRYGGDKFRWLPSDANEPDPQHQAKYGKVYRIGEDEIPGERFGCRCGMEILTKENSTEFE
jgi:hypothetical protein